MRWYLSHRADPIAAVVATRASGHAQCVRSGRGGPAGAGAVTKLSRTIRPPLHIPAGTRPEEMDRLLTAHQRGEGP